MTYLSLSVVLTSLMGAVTSTIISLEILKHLSKKPLMSTTIVDAITKHFCLNLIVRNIFVTIVLFVDLCLTSPRWPISMSVSVLVLGRFTILLAFFTWFGANLAR